MIHRVVIRALRRWLAAVDDALADLDSSETT